MALIDINDLKKTQHDIYQNNIDWVAKQVQVLNDLINGVSDDEDGSELPAVQPLFFRGITGIRIGGAGLIDPSTQQNNVYTFGYAVGVANASIAGEYIGISEPQYIGRDSYLSNSVYASYENDIRNYLEHIYDYFHIQQKEEITDKNIYYTQRGQDFHLGCYNQNVFLQTAWDNTLEYLYGNDGTSSLMVCGFGYSCNVGENNVISSTNLTNLSAPKFQILKEYPVITNNTNRYTDQNYYINYYQNNNNYNTYNYTSNNGDTYNIMVGGGGDGLGGSIIIPFAGGMLNYIDVENMFKLAIDDLNVSLDWGTDGLEPLYFPTYDDVKYEDMGEFYIEPLHQYDKITGAPTFDGTVDFGDIPKVVGESANAYLGLLGGTLSALLCGCFITALIVRKMGR